MNRHGHQIAAVSAGIILVIGLAVICGWELDLTGRFALRPGLEAIVPLTAIGFVLLAIGTIARSLVAREGRGDRARLEVARGFAGLVILIGLSVLLESISSLHLGIDRLLPGTEAARIGRPAPPTALSLVLAGTALWASCRPGWTALRLVEVCTIGLLGLAFTSVIGHLYAASHLLIGANPMSAEMPLATAFVTAVCAIGMIALDPEHVVVRLFTSPTLGGQTVRRLMPMVVILPAVVGWVGLKAVQVRLIDVAQASALAVLLATMIATALVLRLGWLLNHQQQAARQASDMLRELCVRDPLTGLYNRRGWDQLASAEEARCRRTGDPACLISIDLDGLKWINDTQGHDRGDALIRHAAQVIRGSVREEDVVARLGGDEFAVLGIGCDANRGEMLLKRINAALDEARVEASIGRARLDVKRGLVESWRRADEAMYACKKRRKQERAGRPAGIAYRVVG